MKYIDEYRDADAAKKYAKMIHDIVTRDWTLMKFAADRRMQS